MEKILGEVLFIPKIDTMIESDSSYLLFVYRSRPLCRICHLSSQDLKE